MKKICTRLLIFILVVAMLSTSMLAFAIDPMIVEPRYVNVNSCAVNLNISSKGYAACDGNLMLKSGVTADMKVTLFQSEDKSQWTAIDSWSTSGSVSLTINDGCFVMSGHYYYALLNVNVYNSNGKRIEHVALESNVSYY